MFTTEQMQNLIDNGGVVVDNEGNKVGKIGEVYLDDESGRPEWVTAKTGLFGGAETFVPLSDADEGDNEVRVAYDKATIKDAPRMEGADGHLSPEQESELYQHYGLEAGDGDREHRNHDGDHADRDREHRNHDGDHHDGAVGDGESHDRDANRGTTRDASDGDGSMVRSEERVDVGTERVQSGKARLRKYVVTENVTTTVPVEREEVRIEREPIDADGAGQDVRGDGDLGEDEHEVTLTEDRVTVHKDAVPVEKVRVDTDTVTEDREVTEEVRKEQIDSDVDSRDADREH